MKIWVTMFFLHTCFGLGRSSTPYFSCYSSLMVWYGIYFPYKSTIHNINMSFKKTAGFALLSKHLQSIAVFQRGPVNN